MLVEPNRELDKKLLATAVPRFARSRKNRDLLVAKFVSNNKIQTNNGIKTIDSLEELLDCFMGSNCLFAGSANVFQRFIATHCDYATLFKNRELVSGGYTIRLADKNGLFYNVRKGNDWSTIYLIDKEGSVQDIYQESINKLALMNKAGWEIDRFMPPAKMAEDLYRRVVDMGTLPNLAAGEIDEIHIRRALNCFPSGTKIVVGKFVGHNEEIFDKETSIAIEDLKVGDWVLSYNEDKGIKEYDRVMAVASRETENLVQLVFSNGNKLKCTSEHPIAVDNNGLIKWKLAGELICGDRVIQYNYFALALRLFNLRHSANMAGKTMEEIYGASIANSMKTNLSSKQTGHKAPSDLLANPNFGFKKGYRSWNTGLTKSTDSRMHELVEKQRNIKKEKYKDPIERAKFVCRMSGGNQKRPNSYETKMDLFLNFVFSNEWKYVGNRKFWLGNYEVNPDFIRTDEKHRAIEVYSLYWKLRKYGSEEKYISEKRKLYSKYGWECLFLCLDNIDFDNTEHLNFLKLEITNFLYNPGTEIVEVVETSTIKEKVLVHNIETEINHNYFAFGILVHNCVKGGRMESIQLGSFDNVYDFDFNSSHFALMRELPCIKKGFVDFVDSTDYREDAVLAYCLVWSNIVKTCPVGLIANRVGVEGMNPRLFLTVGESVTWRTKKEIDLLRSSKYVNKLEILEGSWVIPKRTPFKPFRAMSIVLERLMNDQITRSGAKLIASTSWGKLASQDYGSLWNPFYAAEILANCRVATTELGIPRSDKLIAFTIDGLLLTERLPEEVITNTNVGGMKVREYDNVVSLSDFYRYFSSDMEGNWRLTRDSVEIDTACINIPYIIKFGGSPDDIGKKLPAIHIPYGSTKHVSPHNLTLDKLQHNQYRLKPPIPEEAIELYFTTKEGLPVGF